MCPASFLSFQADEVETGLRKITTLVLYTIITRSQLTKVTATLPHEKYYDMHAYEKRMAIIRGGESNLLEGLDTYDANADILSHKRGLKRGQAEKESYLSRGELEDLRRVQIERDQVSAVLLGSSDFLRRMWTHCLTQMAKMKLLGMNVDSKTGVRMDTIYDG